MVMLPILLVFTYLIGSISTAIIVCKIFKLPDPRTQGSNNPGATNVLRMGGKKAAAIVFIGDAVKGALPVLIAQYLNLPLLEVTWVALAAFLGHLYPIFFNFKGGKGVATFLGALLGINYLAGLSFVLIWLIVAKLLKISSLSALIATLLTPASFYFITHNLDATYVISLICVWVFVAHKSNIKKILSGDEESI